MSPESFHRPDFNPNDGLPSTERLTRCTICFEPNCTDPSHKLGQETESTPEQESPSWPGLKERKIEFANWEEFPQNVEWEDLVNADDTPAYLSWDAPLERKVTWEPITPLQKTEEENQIIFTNPNPEMKIPLVSVIAPDGTMFAHQNDSGFLITLRITPDGNQEILRCPGAKSTEVCVHTPDGSLIVSQWRDSMKNRERSETIRIRPDGTRSKMKDKDRYGLHDFASAPDGTLFAINQDDEVVRILPNGRMSVLKTMRGIRVTGKTVSVGPDGTLIIEHSLNFWHILSNGKVEFFSKDQHQLKNPQFCPDGCIIATHYRNDTSNDLLRISPDGTTSVLEDRERNWLYAPIITPDNKLIVTDDSKIVVYLPKKSTALPTQEIEPITRKF